MADLQDVEEILEGGRLHRPVDREVLATAIQALLFHQVIYEDLDRIGHRAYVDQAIGKAGTARAVDLPLTCLEDFVIFERLRAIPYGDDQDLRESYQVELTGARFESAWITCPDFTISRAASAEGSAHG